METKDKVAAVTKLVRQSPKRVLTGAKYLIQHGVVGLSERVYEAAVNQEIVDAALTDSRPAGSETGEVKFSIIMPVYNVEPKWLKRAVDSLEDQIYDNWELCIADDCSTNAETLGYLETLRGDHRVKVVFLEENEGISGASNAACELASGRYLVFMDNDDVLSRDALLECSYVINANESDIVYSDQDEISIDDVHGNQLRKPDWSPDLLLSQMYVGHLLCMKKSLFELVGGFRKEFDGSQDYDLVLRAACLANKIDHIDKVLYSWRTIPSSTAADPGAKPYAQTAGLRAIQGYLDDKYGEGAARADETDNYFVYDVRFPVKENVLASIIIPTKDHADDLRKALESIFEKTVNAKYEIVVLDNNSVEPETFEYFAEIAKLPNVRVLDASYEFNWSMLNNHGIREARGDVIVCLNNDVEVISPDWLERLIEDALRPEIGVVGGLLLYPDGTIQHAGVVIGMGGWADHVFKGMEPVHFGSPFVSPMVKRNVSAVTGACMAFSRDLYERIGGFDEEFVVCGSDVEICLRALRHGYRNLYDPYVVLSHYESKSRDASAIPAVDFRMSERTYAEYKASGDPFYNGSLDIMSPTPKLASAADALHRPTRKENLLNEIRPIRFRRSGDDSRRLNILLPSINERDVFGGISTALKFFDRVGAELGCPLRIIVLDAEPQPAQLAPKYLEYEIVPANKSSRSERQIVPLVARRNETLEVGNGDIFIFTIWWSAFCIQNEYMNWDREELRPQKYIYLIQDFEPGFYAWSSRYMLADSTYNSPDPQIAVFNTKLLKDYFLENGYRFDAEYSFEPTLNPVLKEHLDAHDGTVTKRRRILVYARPGTDRNAFELIVEGLREWVATSDQCAQWDMIGAGETFEPVYLGKGRHLLSVGKLTLDQYAGILAESAIGVSLMVSPHPSYPPLEMATFGAKVITNKYGNKDLSKFSDNVLSLDRLAPREIAMKLEELASSFEPIVSCGEVPKGYLEKKDPFPFVSELLKGVC